MTISVSQNQQQFTKIIKSYWNESNPDSFLNLHERIQTCSKKAINDRAESIETIDLAMRNNEPIKSVLTENWTSFNANVTSIVDIETALNNAHRTRLKAQTWELQNPTPLLSGDINEFSNRLNNLDIDVEKVYKDALYPQLQVLRNAEKGWNPAGVICSAWDYVDWLKVSNAKAEVWGHHTVPYHPKNQ